ncbi:ssrAB activated protein [Desulfovibrio sulfodismutans]|uniref:SsrAB activated protein n=1 Tax=Desulfolutivibrio sulfodismutans TaxID=63561 RepID=A0A7K3NL63_9BACT|nr:virulence factor SrfB [Desulfolutivibrio sulfodismutans]NDY56930.1 ssrAB activated protein [Desulfolutivibrio sulfodismutans]QLA12951.1 ssrAB activated protein [Desulfolutivibrio sulfodismutans DSM 3696]
MKEMPSYKSPVSLIPGGCLQYLDFSMDVARVEKLARFFREERRQDGQEQGRHRNVLFCLTQDEDGCFVDMATGKACDYDYEVKAKKTIDIWLDQWIPIPVLRTRDQKWPDGGGRFELGPSNWARCRMMRSADNPEVLRLVVVFDVTVEEPPEKVEQYFALSPQDVEAHATFKVAWHVRDNAWFLNSPWVDEWIFELWTRWLERVRKKNQESDYALEYLANYLVILEVVRTAMQDLAVQVINPKRDNPIDVDFILDIGNSRTSGILVETLPPRITNLNDSYLLQLRDLSDPQSVYTDPFETRVEFVEVGFGNDVLSRRSGRRTPAFCWPSSVRVGPEACRLSTHAVCAEGTTGMSSPKRYLWDERPWQQSWRYNTGGGPEPLVTKGLLPRRVNREGTPLLCEDDPLFKRNPLLRAQEMEIAFESLFTRSSLMMFLLVEILAHALTTINSPAQRARRDLPNVPRRLRRVIFTVPSGMPIAEQRIYRRWVSWAVRVLWDAMGWQDFYVDERQRRAPSHSDYRLNPQVRCNWDEATCTQIVYLFNELTRKFHGDAHHLFGLVGKSRAEADNRPSLRVAAVDIGGGTTDLSITTFILDSDKGSSTRIRPQIEFRDGFSIAGDDILREIVIQHVLPAIGDAASRTDSRSGKAVLAKLFGREGMDKTQQDRNRRALFVRQVAAPLALSLLGVYEQADLLEGSGGAVYSLRDFFRHPDEVVGGEPETPGSAALVRHAWPSQSVIDYVEEGVRRLAPGSEFRLMDVSIRIDPRQIDRTIREAVGRPLSNLCEVIQVYDCDVLLLTGRPSRWPAIISTVYAKLPTPPSRVIPMCRYRVGPWYPFADPFGNITDPKTTVVVGAILCALAEGHLEGFSFDTASLTLRSTARFIGEMEMQTGQLKTDKVWFTVNLDDVGEQELEREVMFAGPITVGFRQLDVERWTTSRFYVIDFATEDARRKASGKLPYTLSLNYRLAELDDAPDAQRDEGEMEIKEITDRAGAGVSRRDVDVRLQTLPLDEGYWLDTGIVYHAV